MQIKRYACPNPAELILRLAEKAYDLCPACYKRHLDGNRIYTPRVRHDLMIAEGNSMAGNAGGDEVGAGDGDGGYKGEEGGAECV